MGDRHAILLENALIDTASPLNLSIPKNLQSQGDPGAYIVQARGPIDTAFRAMLAAAGAEIVSYIPNDAYLVRAPAGAAGGLAAQSTGAGGDSLRAVLQNILVHARDGWAFRPWTNGAAGAAAGGTALNLARLFTATRRRRSSN